MDLRMSVKHIMDKQGRVIDKLKQNLPGPDWSDAFPTHVAVSAQTSKPKQQPLKHHSDNSLQLKQRMCQNISKQRAGVNVEIVSDYFLELEKSVDGIALEKIINYDETNLTDDPGRQKKIFKRGARYPERILNATKSSTSLMLAGTAPGEVLPLHVVYKAEHMWDTWRQDGPLKARYNRSKSGWFDQMPRLPPTKTYTVIRLALHGCTNRPFYHIVLTRSNKKRDASPFEQLGTFDPMSNIQGEKLVSLDTERIMYHLGKGVSMTKPVEKLLGLSGLLPVHPMSYITAMRNRKKMEESLYNKPEADDDGPSES